jgi:putative endonuclease
LEHRLAEHNSGQVSSTRPYRPWTLVYFKWFGTRSEAMAREKRVKSRKSRAFIEKLIKEFISERSAAR